MRWLAAQPWGTLSQCSYARGMGRRSVHDSAGRSGRLAFLAAMKERFSIGIIEDWKKVRLQDVRALEGGRPFLAYYDQSLHAALSDLEENFDHPAHRCSRSLPRTYWASQRNVRAFLDDVAAEMGVETAEQWAKVATTAVWKRGGHEMLRQHGSLPGALAYAYPEVDVGSFSDGRMKAKHHWQEKGHRVAFVHGLAKRLGVSEVQDWKRVTTRVVHAHGGGGLLAYHKNSVFRMLSDVYEEEGLTVHNCRPKVPNRHWHAKENRISHMHALAKELGVTEPRQWGQVVHGDFAKMPGAASLLDIMPLSELLQEAYGEDLEWCQLHCRPSTPASFWQDPQNVKRFLESARDVLEITEKRDWWRVTVNQLRHVPGGSSFVTSGINLKQALAEAFPGQDWPIDVPTLGKKAVQRQVRMAVERLFAKENVIEDYQQKLFKDSGAGRALELDVFLPDLSLAFEYNGEHHYHEIPVFGPLEVTQERDDRKRRMCDEHGIRLVTIPYWWDGSFEAFLATVYKEHPALVRDAVVNES